MKHFLITLLLFTAFSSMRGQTLALPVDCRFVINGSFFKECPMSADLLPKNIVQVGHRIIFYCTLSDSLSLEDLKYSTPVKDVLDADSILAAIRNDKKPRTINFSYNVDPLRPKVGEYIKPFSVRTVAGNVFDNGKIKGQPLVLNFWFTGCKPCIAEMPDANYIAVTYEAPEDIAKLVDERGFRFHQVAGDNDLFLQFKPHAYPLTVLVDKKGLIRYLMDGTSQQKRDFLHQLLKTLYEE